MSSLPKSANCCAVSSSNCSRIISANERQGAASAACPRRCRACRTRASVARLCRDLAAVGHRELIDLRAAQRAGRIRGVAALAVGGDRELDEPGAALVRTSGESGFLARAFPVSFCGFSGGVLRFAGGRFAASAFFFAAAFGSGFAFLWRRWLLRGSAGFFFAASWLHEEVGHQLLRRDRPRTRSRSVLPADVEHLVVDEEVAGALARRPVEDRRTRRRP